MSRVASPEQQRAVRAHMAISAAIGLAPAFLIYRDTHAWERALIAAYVFWSWYWGCVLLWPFYKSHAEKHSQSVARVISYAHWLSFYVLFSAPVGILGGGICCFLKELLSLWGVRYGG